MMLQFVMKFDQSSEAFVELAGRPGTTAVGAPAAAACSQCIGAAAVH